MSSATDLALLKKSESKKGFSCLQGRMNFGNSFRAFLR